MQNGLLPGINQEEANQPAVRPVQETGQQEGPEPALQLQEEAMAPLQAGITDTAREDR